MKMLNRLQHLLGFTPGELKVILFLAGSLLLGAALRWYRLSPGHAAAPAYDYAALDREFRERSQRGRVTPPASVPRPEDGAITPVDLNSATHSDLMSLPGIFPDIAGRIIAYRRDHGGFATVEGLDSVKGIGPKTLARLRPYLRAGRRR